MDVSTAIIFGCFIAVTIAGLYCFARENLQYSLLTVTTVLGVSLSILNIPLFVLKSYRSSAGSPSALSQYSLFLIYTITFLAGVGWFLSEIHWLPLFLGVVGYFTFFIHLFAWLRIKQSSKWEVSIFSLLLGIWLGVSIWSQGSLSPFIWERILQRDMHPETLFHITVSSMLKNYGVSTTGLDGIPKLHYHYGSHILFASLSNLLDIDMILFFELAYPIIFLSLLCTSVLLLTKYLQLLFFSSSEENSNTNWLFWLMIFAQFLGFLPNSLLYKLGMPPLLFFSESYLVAMVLVLLLAIICIDTIRQKNSNLGNYQRLQYVIAVSLTLFLGLTKISHLYIVLAAGWYAALRLPTYRKKIAVFMCFVTLGSFFVYKEVILSDHMGGISLLHYISNVITIKWLPVWLVIGLGAVWCYLLFGYLREKLTLTATNTYFDLELVAWIAVIGLLPAVVLDLGPNGNYFVDAVRWLVFILLLAQSQQLANILQQIVTKYRKLIFNPVVSNGVLIFFSLLLASSLNNLYIQLAKFMTGKQQAQIETITTPRNAVLTLLREMGKDTDHPSTALYLPKSSPFWQNEPNCNDSGFVITSLSGYALLDGAPNSSCDLNRYAYSLYEEQPKKILANDIQSLCQYAAQKKINTIMIVVTDIQQVQCDLPN